MFPVGSARLSVEGERQVRKLAAAFAPSKDEKTETAILVVGHTDATGSASLNQRLSQQRARAVANILAEQGIARDRMYFQGAGASRPIADNADASQRGKNRRVEIVEVSDRNVLVQRINAERNNPKYLAHGTAIQAPPRTVSAEPKAKTEKARSNSTGAAASTASTSAKPARRHTGEVLDFGGQPVANSSWTLGQAITPKKASGLAIISSAYASEIPMRSCESDRPRESGEVLNLASGKALETRDTTDYLPGYNNRVWAQRVNGHLVTLSPVSILRDGASVDRQPFVQIVPNYDKGNRQPLQKANAVANTYEGEDRVLYRVFLKNPEAPLSCMDVVFSKGSAKATEGALFYPVSNGESYTARFVPIRT
nr:OmpA family protein [Stutzerimonas stutzeri]